LSDVGIKELAGLKTLKLLEIARVDITDEGIKAAG